MQMIFLSNKKSMHSVNIKMSLAVLVVSVFFVLSTTLGFLVAKKLIKPIVIADPQYTIVMDKPLKEIEAIRTEAKQRLNVYSNYLADAQAKLMRIDALGKRLVKEAGLSEDEFNFSDYDVIDAKQAKTYSPPRFINKLDKLAALLGTREKQLEILDKIIAKRKLQRDHFVSGMPVAEGRVSSPFTVRSDPFTGRKKNHRGIDFAAPKGTNILSVANGVVTYSGWKNGYGNVVEVTHLGGYKTLYAHNNENISKVGDLVQSNQVIAKVGSTGRSTGNHVHFEVMKDNVKVNPTEYITRVSPAATDITVHTASISK